MKLSIGYQLSRFATVILLGITGSPLGLSSSYAEENSNLISQAATIQKFVQAKTIAIPNQYIVVLKEDDPSLQANSVSSVATQLTQSYGGSVQYIYKSAIKGYSVQMSQANAVSLSEDRRVKYVEEDSKVSVNTIPWGLDRIDQRDLPLNDTYLPQATGVGVTVYVIDTGVLTTHQEFGSRASIGYDALGGNGQDCNGHGTHVAGISGGNTYGVAKDINIIGVRVLDCEGQGDWSSVIAGVDWVTANHTDRAVVNMSLGGGANLTVDDAIRNSITSGVTYTIAAGNSGDNASNYSPARVQEAITVAATDAVDSRPLFSNYGSVVDLFAPGVDIPSAWIGSNTANQNLSGTSMAAPHVAGVAALYIETNPTASPTDIQQTITNNSTSSKVIDPVDSPNRLLFAFDVKQTLLPLYRYWNSSIGDHFYTTNFGELGSGKSGYSYEGIQSYICPNTTINRCIGGIPLYRYWNPSIGDHFYTTNFSELGSGSSGYIYEGIQGYVHSTFQSGTVPLYRYWNPSIGDHFYTTNFSELGSGSSGYSYEGIQGYVFP